MGYLLENGHLLRTARVSNTPPNFAGAAGRGGRVEEYDWDGNLIWAFEYVGTTYLTHHDIEPLPNGNLLMIVWEWRARDHLIQDYDPAQGNFGVVENHPELVDFNFGQNARDWTHFSSIDYNAELDQIVISTRGLNEIWVIDHSTTTTEAAGHTGETAARAEICSIAGAIPDPTEAAEWPIRSCPGSTMLSGSPSDSRERGIFLFSTTALLEPWAAIPASTRSCPRSIRTVTTLCLRLERRLVRPSCLGPTLATRRRVLPPPISPVRRGS
jgi:hypothetical protein